MRKSFSEKICPRCHAGELKTWRELDADEQIAAKKMPLSAEFSSNERKRHLFCPRCWFEEPAGRSIDV